MVPPGCTWFCAATRSRRAARSCASRRARCACRSGTKTEMLTAEVPSEQAERLAAAVRRLEFDGSLGPYPLEAHAQWAALSRHVDERVLTRAGVPLGTRARRGRQLVPTSPGFDAALAAQGDRRRAAARRCSAAPPPRPPQGPTIFRRAAARLSSTSRSASARRAPAPGEARTRYDRSEWPATARRAGPATTTPPLSSAAGEVKLLGELALAFVLFLTVRRARRCGSSCCCTTSAARRRSARGRPRRRDRALRAQLELAPPDFRRRLGGHLLRAASRSPAPPPTPAASTRACAARSSCSALVRERRLDVPQLMRDEDEFADDEDMPVVEDVDGVLQGDARPAAGAPDRRR